ncbi:MAG: choice-of-anchor D domain-containing protein [Deltaproteobacteria bacterium]|nr:choice-of-anchor D domain-containing protein [Deltaproteobacteria bacterium]
MKRLLALSLLAACSDYKVEDLEPSPGQLNNQPEPCITVDPETVQFTDLKVTVDPVQVQDVTVSNACEGDLEIYGIGLSEDDAPFRLGSIGSIFVPSGGQTSFSVTFDPQTANDWTTQVLLDSNDPNWPTKEVQLLATGIAPVIEVTPPVYDFGTPYIGCSYENEWKVRNVGNDTLTVDHFGFAADSDDFAFDPALDVNGELGWTLAPQEEATVYINYQGLDEFADQAYLTVSSSDPFTPQVLVSATGNALYYGDTSDDFAQSLQSSTDIIFTLDRSGSMDDDNALVVANFSTFVNTLTTLDADYHVAVVVDDDGCVRGGSNYIDASFSSSDAEATFSTMADILGNYGSYTEAGYTLAERGLQAANIGPGGCNEGMYRDEAFLSLVHVSDEVEQSSRTYSYYVSLFQAMKANPDDVVINAVAGDYPGGCGSADPGTGYYEGTVATGGLFLSLCTTDWGTHLESLAARSVALRSSFRLSSAPVPQTLEVKVNGTITTSGWRYNAATNAVVFERDHIPAGGSSIDVAYHLMPRCD